MPRAYPRGYALKMLEGYETHLQNCGEGRRDLRFKPQVGGNLSELEQFKKLPIGDPWEDAQMMELLEYLMTSKRVRTDFLHEEFLWNLTMLLGHISCFLTLAATRIPEEWCEVMDTFYDDYRSLVSLPYKFTISAWCNKGYLFGTLGGWLERFFYSSQFTENIFNTQVIQRFVLKGVIHLGIKCHQQTTNKIRLTTFFGKPWPSIFRRGWISYPRIYSLFPKA